MNNRCIRLAVSGQVQGVGFRPHSARVANQHELRGWVCNSSNGVIIEVEGSAGSVTDYISSLTKHLPLLARIDDMQVSDQCIVGHEGFEIRDSAVPHNVSNTGRARITPDAATCKDCLREMRDKSNRRFRHPFICCTHCGPRYSVTRELPYDRSRTTMAEFELCADCEEEYANSNDRRFHAQAICCPYCGPQLRLLDGNLTPCSHGDDALLQAADAIRRGCVVAIKGLGGYQLLVDAQNDEAIRTLRDRKQRPDKPFAIMLSNVLEVEPWCEMSSQERQLLESVHAPIVLLQRAHVVSQLETLQQVSARNSDKRNTVVNNTEISNTDESNTGQHDAGNHVQPIADSVAPGSGLMGCMLPHTPVHHLLMEALGFPVVATSANRSGQPLVSDERQLVSIAHIADVFLIHDRPIACTLDDSVVRVVADRPLLIRAARGYTPITLTNPDIDRRDSIKPLTNRHSVLTATPALPSVLALGGQQKSTLSLADEQHIVVGPHRGDLDSVETRQAYRTGIDDFIRLHGADLNYVACDEHPDYYTTQMASEFASDLSGGLNIPANPVQHHLAHVIACTTDNAIDGPVLGVAWDGTGYSPDGVIRGGEFMVVDGTEVKAVVSLKTFALPGGEQCVKEPRRSALSAIYELLGDAAFTRSDIACMAQFTSVELELLQQMLSKEINSPRTSSAGRLFDALASTLGLATRSSFEGQAAMALEAAAMVAHRDTGVLDDTNYALLYTKAGGPAVRRFGAGANTTATLDWTPLLQSVIDDLQCGVPCAHIAMKVHTALADGIVTVAQHIGLNRVVLSGGCFQNRLLTEVSVQRLEDAGFSAYWHKNLPANDGSLSVGQALWAQRCHAAEFNNQEVSCA